MTGRKRGESRVVVGLVVVVVVTEGVVANFCLRIRLCAVVSVAVAVVGELG